jgi:hypothetical protein
MPVQASPFSLCVGVQSHSRIARHHAGMTHWVWSNSRFQHVWVQALAMPAAEATLEETPASSVARPATGARWVLMHMTGKCDALSAAGLFMVFCNSRDQL